MTVTPRPIAGRDDSSWCERPGISGGFSTENRSL